MNQVVHDGIRWEVQPEFAALLPAVLAAPGQTVKESPAKLITVHSVGGTDYYVKRYRHLVKPLRALGYLFRASPALNEWRLALAVGQRNIPIVRHLALGERRTAQGMAESIVVTEGFNGIGIGHFRDDSAKMAATVALVHQMHDAGVLQRDLHPGNILMSTAGELRLVDLDGAVLKAALTREEREENLAYLCIHLPLPVPAEIRALTRQVRSKALADRSERCFKENREFGIERFGRHKWFVRRPLLRSKHEAVLAAPDTFLARAKTLKAGRSSSVGAADGMVLKRYNLRHWFNPAKDLFRPSKARKGFQRAYHLELAGIRTARPVAAADDFVAGLPVRSFFLMEEIPGAVALPLWPGDKAAALRTVAELMAKMHHEGFSHRDLKDSNIVFDGEGRPYLIDLDGLRFVQTAPDERAAADLTRLAQGMPQWRQKLSRGDRARFLVYYCRARELADWRWWWREIAKQL